MSSNPEIVPAVRLVLVRHAESTANVDGYFDSVPPGPPLSDSGQAQAAALAVRLAGSDVRAVVCSPATRAMSTALPVADGHGVELRCTDDVLEIHCGDLERRRDPESRAIFSRVFSGWLTGDKDESLPGGENGVQVEERMLRAVNRLAAEHLGGDLVVVGHGGSIRVLLGALVGAQEAGKVGFMANAGSITLRAAVGGTWVLDEYDAGDDSIFDSIGARESLTAVGGPTSEPTKPL